MKKIKFRAWDKKRKIMIGSDYSNNWDNNEDEWYADIAKMELAGIEIISKDNNYIIMQYIGVKDKNNKAIYEDDIVKRVVIKADNSAITDYILIRYDEINACYNLYDNMQSGVKKIFEIDGNFHENYENIKKLNNPKK